MTYSLTLHYAPKTNGLDRLLVLIPYLLALAFLALGSSRTANAGSWGLTSPTVSSNMPSSYGPTSSGGTTWRYVRSGIWPYSSDDSHIQVGDTTEPTAVLWITMDAADSKTLSETTYVQVGGTFQYTGGTAPATDVDLHVYVQTGDSRAWGYGKVDSSDDEVYVSTLGGGLGNAYANSWSLVGYATASGTLSIFSQDVSAQPSQSYSVSSYSSIVDDDQDTHPDYGEGFDSEINNYSISFDQTYTTTSGTGSISASTRLEQSVYVQVVVTGSGTVAAYGKAESNIDGATSVTIH